MKSKYISCLVAAFFVLFVSGAEAQQPSVYDIQVHPDSLNKKVTVDYRITPTGSGYADVSVNISSNAGVGWTVPADTFYPGSDVGAGVSADGSVRQFIWDARTDWNNEYSTQMLIRIEASETQVSNWIYFVAGEQLYRVDTDGNNFTPVCSVPGGAYPLEYDKAHSRILFSRWDNGAELRFFDVLGGTSLNYLNAGPGNGGQGLAYDAAKELYFLGLYYNGLYKLDLALSGSWQHLVTPSDLSPTYGPRGQLDLDPANEKVYFRSTYNGPCDSCRHIWRVDYDGQGLTNIVRANDGDGLDLDLAAGKMYFSDENGISNPPPNSGNLIKRANLDGTNIETIFQLNNTRYDYCRTMHLDPVNGKLYMSLLDVETGFRDRAIASMNVDGSGFEILVTLDYSVYGSEGGTALVLK